MPDWSQAVGNSRRDCRLLSPSVNVEGRTTPKPGSGARGVDERADTTTRVAAHGRERNGHQQIQHSFQSRVLKTCTGVSGRPQMRGCAGSFLPSALREPLEFADHGTREGHTQCSSNFVIPFVGSVDSRWM